MYTGVDYTGLIAVVPVYGVDQQPFAMICAYTCDKAKQYLEGYELQFLRAIGVIILSAVLRRRMVLADKTKSILISSVSHELRTPLHGILAAAELLSDTDLDANQISFLKTVQTCGNSLIETVNHVLDFTKLSGSTPSTSSTIKHARVNLASLVESTVEGCWIGQRARFFHGDSDIGSFYAPPAPSGLIPKQQRASVGEKLAHVETVIDIAQREKGWNVRCEKGGLRRVLMNLVGNSLKFTKVSFLLRGDRR
jgi:signal transduction histidine kinase